MPDFYSDPGLYPNREYVNQDANEYIDPFTGALQRHYVDLHIPGNGGFDLKVIRSYNSVSVDSSKPHAYQTLLGLGWTIHFGRIITNNRNSYCSNRVSTVVDNPVLELPDGSRQLITFIYGTDPGWPAVWSIQGWRVDCLTSTLKGGFSVYSPDGTRYDMTQVGILGSSIAWYTTKITDKNGNYADITYSKKLYEADSNESHQINSVTTNDGRRIDFTYADNNKPSARIASISGAGQTYYYQYQVIPGGEAYLLTSVTKPDGLLWEYSYNGPPSIDPSSVSALPAERFKGMGVSMGGSSGAGSGSGGMGASAGSDSGQQGVRMGGSSGGGTGAGAGSGGDAPEPQGTGNLILPGAYLMNQATYPWGGSARYVYGSVCFDLRSKNSGCVDVVNEKSLSTGGRWFFNYSPGSQGALDVTTLTDPTGTVTTYKHVGPNYSASGTVWMVGLLIEKNIGNVQAETNTWSKQPMSYEKNLRNGTFSSKVDQRVYRPILTGKTVTRDGGTHNTTYDRWDLHANPGRAVEYGPGGNRTTNLTYHVDRSKWIVHQVKNESFSGSSIARGFDSNGNLTSVTNNGVTTIPTITRAMFRLPRSLAISRTVIQTTTAGLPDLNPSLRVFLFPVRSVVQVTSPRKPTETEEKQPMATTT